jgi:hypothetical protein
MRISSYPAASFTWWPRRLHILQLASVPLAVLWLGRCFAVERQWIALEVACRDLLDALTRAERVNDSVAAAMSRLVIALDAT